MKKLHLLALVTFMFVACSDDNDSPKSLRYSSKTTEFKVWVGSETGGKEITSEVKMNDMFADVFIQQMTEYEQRMKSLTLSFITDDECNFSLNGGSFTTNYRLEDGALSFYDVEDGEWWLLGYGDKNQLIAKGGILGSYGENGRGGEYETERYFSLEEGLSKLGYSSLNEMTKVTDTIALCNFGFIIK